MCMYIYTSMCNACALLLSCIVYFLHWMQSTTSSHTQTVSTTSQQPKRAKSALKEDKPLSFQTPQKNILFMSWKTILTQDNQLWSAHCLSNMNSTTS